MRKSQFKTVSNEASSSSVNLDGHQSLNHFNSSTKYNFTPNDKNINLNTKPTLDSHGFEFIEDDQENLSNNSEDIQNISTLKPKDNSGHIPPLAHTNNALTKLFVLIAIIFVILSIFVGLSMPNDVNNFLHKNALFKNSMPLLSNDTNIGSLANNQINDKSQSNQKLTLNNDFSRSLEQGSSASELTDRLDSNSIILNTNPEADPDVQEAINTAVGKDLDTHIDKQVTNDYYEFLKASETPLIVEEYPPETLQERFERIEEIHVEHKPED